MFRVHHKAFRGTDGEVDPSVPDHAPPCPSKPLTGHGRARPGLVGLGRAPTSVPTRRRAGDSSSTLAYLPTEIALGPPPPRPPRIPGPSYTQPRPPRDFPTFEQASAEQRKEMARYSRKNPNDGREDLRRAATWLRTKRRTNAKRKAKAKAKAAIGPNARGAAAPKQDRPEEPLAAAAAAAPSAAAAADLAPAAAEVAGAASSAAGHTAAARFG